MQFTTLAATFFAATALAAPALMKRDVVGTWTILGATRNCDDDGCHWSFGIDRHDGSEPQSCDFDQPGGPQSDVTEPQACGGPYTVTLGWNPQGFSTFPVKDSSAGLIAYFSFDDNTMAGVAPDTDFAVEN